MKKIISLILAVLMTAAVLAGCSDEGAPGTVLTVAGDDQQPGTDAPASVETIAETTEAQTESAEKVPSGTIKILAIGNSFSTDAMQYLYQIMKSAGYENIVLGNLYYGGCSLAEHLSFAKNKKANYTYYKNTTGTWGSTANYVMDDALADEEWDYISFQQESPTCGVAATYGKTLTQLVDYVAERVSEKTVFMWHMTWAYQSDSTHSAFPTYNRDQMKMYNMIIDCVKECILPEERFSFVIPCGTAIQNARTSFIGDHLTRDGYHMDYFIGRYIDGLTWYAAISGASVDRVAYNPSTDKITADMMAVAKESVKNAMAAPYEVTPSAITTGEMPGKTEIDPTVILNPADFFEADKAVAQANGVDLSKYQLLEWDYLENTYWNCTSRAGTTTPASSAGTYHQNVCSKTKYSLEQVPVGSLFICDADWQYRLDIYTDTTSKYNGTRPAMTTTQFFTLTPEFLNGCTYIAWNIAASPKADISAIYAQAACHMRVYVPVK